MFILLNTWGCVQLMCYCIRCMKSNQERLRLSKYNMYSCRLCVQNSSMNELQVEKIIFKKKKKKNSSKLIGHQCRCVTALLDNCDQLMWTADAWEDRVIGWDWKWSTGLTVQQNRPPECTFTRVSLKRRERSLGFDKLNMTKHWELRANTFSTMDSDYL